MLNAREGHALAVPLVDSVAAEEEDDGDEEELRLRDNIAASTRFSSHNLSITMDAARSANMSRESRELRRFAAVCTSAEPCFEEPPPDRNDERDGAAKSSGT